MLHYLIIGIIILLIVIMQWRYFIDTSRRITSLQNIFPNVGIYSYIQEDEEQSNHINANHENDVFMEVIRSINTYLSTNKGRVSDFHLMKDIVDRNCDTAEEEIDAQVPVPLYLGLMGTMAGILVGIGYLWLSGDLYSLLNSGANNSMQGGADGVQALLGGVALAMISSIMGIFLTTAGSMRLKGAKSKLQKGKHVFLSWMQANMLPHLNNDTAQVLERMSQNLTRFNKEFYQNTRKMESSLSQVAETSSIQVQLIESVNKLANKQVAKQNLDLYNALSNSTTEIGKLAELLHDSTEYLNAVRELNERLDKGERRSEAIERMVDFFELETQQIDQRKQAMTQAVGQIDSTLEENLRKLGQHANANIESFYQALGKQQDALQKKLSETEGLLQELKNMAPIKESISKFERATRDQNTKIDALTGAIRQLAEMKTAQPNATVSEAHGKERTRQKLKKGIRIGVAIVVVLALMALTIANWDNICDFLEIFEF